jgi:hypothetical protein
VAATARELGVSERQVYRLLRRCREGGGELSSLLPTGSGGGRGKPRLEARHDDLVCDVVDELYLTPQRLSAERIVQEVRRRAVDRKLQPPSASTVRRRIAALTLEERRRRGDVEPPAPVEGATPRARSPLEVVQIDHPPVDLILVDPIERQPIGRPWITVPSTSSAAASRASMSPWSRPRPQVSISARPTSPPTKRPGWRRSASRRTGRSSAGRGASASTTPRSSTPRRWSGAVPNTTSLSTGARQAGRRRAGSSSA